MMHESAAVAHGGMGLEGSLMEPTISLLSLKRGVAPIQKPPRGWLIAKQSLYPDAMHLRYGTGSAEKTRKRFSFWRIYSTERIGRGPGCKYMD